MPLKAHPDYMEFYFSPQTRCFSCGSTNVDIGCPYQDCEKCEDMEFSACRDCGTCWGGANYWK